MIVLQTKQEYLFNKNKLINNDPNIIFGTRKKKEKPGNFVGIVNEKINIIDIYIILDIIKYDYFRNKEDNICYKCKRNKLVIGNKIFSLKYDIYLKTHHLIYKITPLRGTILCPFNLHKLDNKNIIFNKKKIDNICDELNNIKL